MTEKLSLWNVLLAYLRQRRKLLCFLAVLAGICGLLFVLYRLEPEAFVYMMMLWLFAGLIAVSVDFGLFYSRHRKLESLRANILYSLEELPDPRNLIEEDYDDALRALFCEKQRVQSAGDREKSAMIEYYTLWAHQIKTPIAAMRLLLQSEESEQNRDLLAELFRVEQYVEMVLSYLRLGSSSSDFVIQKYPLEKIVRHAVRKYAPLFIRKKIRLEMGELHSQVLTDEKWLEFVLEQLISNAVKYTKEGGTIRIWMDGPQTLAISDTGIGIRREDLPRVFERGFTGFNGRSQKRATGLGLYLCSRILGRLSHRIYIDSAPGQGTTVRIGMDMVDLNLDVQGSESYRDERLKEEM